MRNPKWHRDEIILALDLYFRLEPGQIHAKNPDVLALSELLNKLPIHTSRPDAEKFRNPNGVGLKLSNFLAIDPNYEGKGMASFSNLDKAVFEEFKDDRLSLKSIARQIKATVENQDLRPKLYRVPEEEDEESLVVKEGKVIYKLHRVKERNPSINNRKKADYMKKYGKLDCEVCGFDFQKTYGELGNGYIECHHRTPLHSLDGEVQTRLKDLALVCSNCHRMLHRKISSFSVEDLINHIC